MYETLIVEREGAVAWVTLNRPERLNTLTPVMARELWTFFRDLQTDYATRVVVLRGAGRGFCAGLDIKEAAGSNRGSDSMHVEETTGPAWSLSGIIRGMRRAPQPIIALVHGPACGGGFAMALAADIRIAGESARMNDAFIRIGMSGCELGLSYHLPRIVGLSVAAELMMTGDFIDANRALQTGLVSRVVADDQMAEAARPLIASMLRATPLGLRKTKETLYRAMDLADLDAVIELEEHTQMSCTRTGDFDEAMAAFIEKREPRFGLSR